MLDDPTDDFMSACWVGLRVTRLAYVNTVTGEVLRAWDESSPPATMMEDMPAYLQR